MFRAILITIYRKNLYLFRIVSRIWKFPNIIFEIFFPIVNDFEFSEKLKNTKFCPEIFYAFIFFLYLLLDSLFLLYKFGYDLDHPYLYHHVTLGYMPKFFRKQGDVIYFPCFLLTIYCTFNLISPKMPHLQFIMFPSSNQSKILFSLANKGKNSL